ncbi:MAG: HAD hydrolase-like protein [Chloroflexi bacterium]|nr:HAD hydrolase-like protein [Chloroflexota bacterium]
MTPTLTLLIDLDDTLLGNGMDTFIPAYLGKLGQHMAGHFDLQEMPPVMFAATERMFQNQRPDRTLEETFDPHFYKPLGMQKSSVRGQIDEFYEQEFSKLEGLTHFIPEAVEFIAQALERGYRIGIATNPLFPRTAIVQRLRWAGLDPQKYPFALIPSYETFHFAKPNPAYFAEFLSRIGWPEGPILMIGNDPDHDVRGANGLGLPVFWITELGAEIPDGFPAPTASGALTDVLPWIDSQPPEQLKAKYETPSAIIATLRGCAAALAGMTTEFPHDWWGKCPDPEEWCLTAIICHLRDVEHEINLPRLQAITRGENPFIPGVDSDIWAAERGYKQQNGEKALANFLAARIETLELLDELATSDWKLPAHHAIFGPTRLDELAGFMARHDRLHIRQVHKTIETITRLQS